ncbi:MAG TPA: c-type cytochrome [Methylomirabilota bacterium]|nr:c-type cytochrome [Methylomirabilota bacterium]
MNRASLIIAGLGLLMLGVSIGWGAARLTGKELEEAKELYTDACASCHGDNGKGQVSGLGVTVELPDFTWCAFNSDESDRDWYRVVAEGGPASGRSEQMPSFGNVLTEEQIKLVVAYLRTFCSEDWPSADLNFPRPLVTEKAYPENEIIFTWNFARALNKDRDTQFGWSFEKRIGARGQIELNIPFNIRDPKDGATVGGVGDLEAGLKYVLYDNPENLFILSGGLGLGIPTGSFGRELGEGTTTLAPFLATGKAWGDFVAQGSLKFEYPFVTRRLPKGVFYDLALSYPVFDRGRGTELQAMMEFNAKNEWGNPSSKPFQLYLTPGFRKGLVAAGNWAIGFGVQIPVTREREANYRVLGYLLYELPPLRFE